LKIVFYNKTLLSGGIEKCLELLSKEIYKDYEIDIIYTVDDILDENIVNILKKYANVYKIEDQIIECDVMVWCYLYFDYHKLKKQIKAKKNIAWIHSMPRILPDCLLDDKEFIDDMDEIVCVSEAVKNNLNVSKDGIVIHNFVANNINELSEEFNPFENISGLKLVSVSRLSRGKGFDRLLLLAKKLKEKNIDFSIKIIGKGRSTEKDIRDSFKDFDEVEFVGYKENPYPYVKNADYLVQLSDDESWCNSITESKVLSTPVLVTNFESSKEQIEDLKNGIVIPLEEKEYDNYISKILDNKEVLRENLKSFIYKNEIDKWIELIEKEKN